MSNADFLVSNAKLHKLVESIDSQMAEATPVMKASWAELITALNIPPVIESYACPNCGHLCIRGAKLCGHCWHTLTRD